MREIRYIKYYSIYDENRIHTSNKYEDNRR